VEKKPMHSVAPRHLSQDEVESFVVAFVEIGNRSPVLKGRDRNDSEVTRELLEETKRAIVEACRHTALPLDSVLAMWTRFGGPLP
jgi:hypothetical protein